MTIDQKINQLIILRDSAHDRYRKEALEDAITLMMSKHEFYDLAYMRGYRDAKKKGAEA